MPLASNTANIISVADQIVSMPLQLTASSVSVAITVLQSTVAASLASAASSAGSPPVLMTNLTAIAALSACQNLLTFTSQPQVLLNLVQSISLAAVQNITSIAYSDRTANIDIIASNRAAQFANQRFSFEDQLHILPAYQKMAASVIAVGNPLSAQQDALANMYDESVLHIAAIELTATVHALHSGHSNCTTIRPS